MTPSRIIAVAALTLLAACATPGGPDAYKTRPASGGMVVKEPGRGTMQGSFWTGRVSWGPEGGEPVAFLDRTPGGNWKGTIEGVTDPVEILPDTDRITGPDIDVGYAAVPGGFRIQGWWRGSGVDLVVAWTELLMAWENWPRGPEGTYAKPGPYMVTVRFSGDATRIDAPTWPQMPLLLLLSGLGRKGTAAPPR